MKFILFLIMMALVSGNVVAQAFPNAGFDTVRSGIVEESLAPLPLKPAPSETMAAAPVAAGASEAIGVEAEASPFVVKNVTVTLSGTTGFDRDAALEKAARQAMPGVLENMGITAEAAASTVKSLGAAMTFVKSYKVVKETLIPTYTLTSDLTFNDVMMRKNFGGKVAEKAEVQASSVGETQATAADDKPVNQWVVKIIERDPALVERVRVNLGKQAGTRAAYRLLTSGGAELVVDTPLSAEDIVRLAGQPVEVRELEIKLPSGMVQTGQGDPRAWQGQEQPPAPLSPPVPGIPGIPSAPNDPNGGNY